MYEASPFEFDEQYDTELTPAWFVDNTHKPPLADYIGMNWIGDLSPYGFCWAAEHFSFPTCRGIIWRSYKNIRVMITPLVIDDPEEIKRREAKFRKNLVWLSENFGTEWEKLKAEMTERYKPFRAYDYASATTLQLARMLADIRQLAYRMVEVHFWALYGSLSFYSLFQELCRELFGIDTSNKDFNDMLGGLDSKILQGERELWKLANLVRELGLEKQFEAPAQDIAPSIKGTAKGDRWLAELTKFLDEYGFRCELCWVQSSPCWRDDPCYTIEKIQHYLKRADFDPFQQMKLAIEVRDTAVAKYTAKVPDNKKDLFKMLLKGAQYADMVNQEHDFYCEMQIDAFLHLAIMELGKKFVKIGTIDDPYDIFYLGLDEIRKTAPAPERWHLQKLIAARKAKAKADVAQGIPDVISKTMTKEQAFEWMMKSREPNIIFTLAGELPKAKPELGADIIGMPGATGIAEGPARLVFSGEDLAKVKVGDILVSPTTSISWTTVFALVKGAVLDRGGALSHAAVACREYGIPCIVNTFVGTSKIQDGQRIRVDGAKGAVYILDKS